MNENWRSIAELFGLALVAGSLVFVGLQLNQDRVIARAQLYQASQEGTSEDFRTFIEGHDVIAISVKAEAGDKLSEVETRALELSYAICPRRCAMSRARVSTSLSLSPASALTDIAITS